MGAFHVVPRAVSKFGVAYANFAGGGVRERERERGKERVRESHVLPSDRVCIRRVVDCHVNAVAHRRRRRRVHLHVQSAPWRVPVHHYTSLRVPSCPPRDPPCSLITGAVVEKRCVSTCETTDADLDVNRAFFD